MNALELIEDILTNPNKYEEKRKAQIRYERNVRISNWSCDYFVVEDKEGTKSSLYFVIDDLHDFLVRDEYAELNKEELVKGKIAIYGYKILKDNTLLCPKHEFIGQVAKDGRLEKCISDPMKE